MPTMGIKMWCMEHEGTSLSSWLSVHSVGNCSYELERHLLLGNKSMTSLVGCRELRLPTKLCIVRTTAFSTEIYGCESSKGEWRKNWCLGIVALDKCWESFGLNNLNYLILDTVKAGCSIMNTRHIFWRHTTKARITRKALWNAWEKNQRQSEKLPMKGYVV